MKTFLENSLFIYLFKVFYKAIATIADSILVYKMNYILSLQQYQYIISSNSNICTDVRNI